jgi:hypothetical protein
MIRKFSWITILIVVSILVVAVIMSTTASNNQTLPNSIASTISIYLPSVLKPIISPSSSWDLSIGNATIIPNAPNVPIYQWFPDGHISVLKDSSDKWMMFWAEFESYRTLGSAPYPENQTELSPTNKVFGERGGDGWDNGGSWLNSVHNVSGNSLVGFYHAEDHWYPPNLDGIAWKSIAVTYSNDNGITWSLGQQIITAWELKPTTPEWGGAGDHSVVWDHENQQWVCLYQEQVENGEAQIHVAVSSDLQGGPGTWFKWNGNDFTIPGLGGKGEPLPAFKGHEGGNPSVHWNTYLGKWIMVYGGWDGVIYLSSSTDLINWDIPQALVTSDQGGRAWYPTIIGDSGDTVAGQNSRLYYADIANDFSSRKFYARDITFMRYD